MYRNQSKSYNLLHKPYNVEYPTRPLRKLIQTTMTKPITESSENFSSFKNTGENTGLDYARLSISTEMNDRVILFTLAMGV